MSSEIERACDCCRRNEPVGVASSAMGAISFAFCGECLIQNAEPEMMFEFTAWVTGGDAAPHVNDFTTFVDGRYIGWSEWIASERGIEAIKGPDIPEEWDEPDTSGDDNTEDFFT